MLQIPKVLIACPISERKSYCIDAFLEHITNFTYPRKTFYFSDNSQNPNWAARKIVYENGIDCDWISPEGKKSNQYIAESQQQIREHFLNSDADYLFSLECDIFPDRDVIETLLAENEGVCAMKYFIGEGAQSHILAQETDDSWSENTNRNQQPLETFIEHGRKNTATNYGLGCVLLSRKVVEEINFRVDERSEIHSDNYFSVDLRDSGYKIKVLDKIVTHHNKKCIV